MAAKLKMLLEQIDTRMPNAEIIRENFRRIKAYLDLINADQLVNLSQTIAQTVNLDIGAYNRMNAFDCTSNNQIYFTLSEVPAHPDTASAMIINGVRLVYGDHYTIVGNLVTFNPVAAGFQIETINELGSPDRIVIYFVV